MLNTKEPQRGLRPAPKAAHNLAFRPTQRQLSLALMGLALVYAFLSGFHTLYDLDMGWHLATGRYVVQHHAVPTTDVLSYTSPGAGSGFIRLLPAFCSMASTAPLDTEA